MKRFWLVLIVALIIAALVAPALLAKSRVPNPKVSKRPNGKMGGTLITTFLSDPKTFNIVTSKDNSSTQAVTLLYDGLQEEDGVTTAVEPALAEKWSFSKDGLVWTFVLREGLTWHDGKPVTADDMVFTFDVIYDPNIPTSWRDVLTVNDKPIKCEKVDARTIKLTLPAPFAPLLRQLPPPIPKHILYDDWKAGKFNETYSVACDPKTLIGTGPFKMVEYKPGERLVYERYNNYWKENKGRDALPYLDRWVRVICPNRETESLKFKSGEVDGLADVKADEWKKYQDEQAIGNYTCYNGGPTFSTNFIVFNMNPRAPVFKSDPIKLKWFTNQKFRQGLAYAVDKDTMIRQVYKGLAEPQWSPVSTPNKQFLNTKVKTYEYNLKKAQTTLASAGFKKDKNGVLRDPDGNIVKFTMETNSENSQRVMMLNIMAEDLKKLGIQVTLTPISFNQMLDHLQTNFNYEVMMIGLTGSVEPNNGRNVWHSSGQLHMWNPVQEKPATAWEARVDEIFDKGATVMNVSERKQLYDEWQMIISEQVPLIYTVAPLRLFAMRNRVKNAVPTSYGGLVWNIFELYLQ